MKAVGIWMVLINHSHNYVYSTELLFKLSRSCVQILLFCAGINTFLKLRSVFVKDVTDRSISSLLWKWFWWPRFKSIFVPYIVFNAGFLFLWKKKIDFKTMWQYVMEFNISNPVYFIPVFIELIFIAPLIYYLILRFDTKWGHFALGLISLPVCIWFASHTYMLPIYGAGQYFVGATYGWVFILGMLFGNRLCKNQTKYYSVFSAILPIGLLTIWGATLKIFPDAHTKFERLFLNIGGNPPGPDSLVEGFLMIWVIFTVASFADRKFGDCLVHVLAPLISCGKNSLYIFLWHMFIKAAWNQIIVAAGLPSKSLLYAIPFYLGSTLAVILVKNGVDFLKQDMITICLKRSLNKGVST